MEVITQELNYYLPPEVAGLVTDFFAPIYFALHNTRNELTEMELVEFLNKYVTSLKTHDMHMRLRLTLDALHDNVYEEICHLMRQANHPKVKSGLELMLEEQEDCGWLRTPTLFDVKNWNHFTCSVYKMWARKIYHCLGDLSIERRFFRMILLHLSIWGDKDDKVVFREFMGGRLIDDDDQEPEY